MMSNENLRPCSAPCLSSKKSKVFKCGQHADNISQKLQSFYERKPFFDIVLVAGVDNVELQAHWIILSASSGFFLGMSRSPLQEAIADKVELKELDGITMRKIIDFMYTAEIEMDCETVETILRAADFLQINTLIDGCCEFMEEQLDAGNCLGISLLAEQHNYKELHRKAFLFACVHFDEVCNEKEFVLLNEEQLSKYLSNAELITRSEENVFQSVLTWIQHDKESRGKCTYNLLSHVCFTLLTLKFIVDNRHSVCESIECYELVCSWYQWHLSPESRSLFATYNTKARKAKQKLAAVSGSTKNLKLHTLNRELNAWSEEQIPLPLKLRILFTAAVVRKKMIIGGGRIDGAVTNSVEYLDLQINEWVDLPPMKIARESAGMAELNGDLYVVGGYSGTEWLCSVEKYDFYTRKWKKVAPLNSPFVEIAITVDGGVLYATGRSSNVVDSYDLAENKWNQTANNEKVSGFGIAAVCEHLYAFGGSDENQRENLTIGRYHRLTDTWSSASTVRTMRSSSMCVALNNRVIVCGGFNNGALLNLIEEYDPEADEWNSLPPLPSQVLASLSNIVAM